MPTPNDPRRPSGAQNRPAASQRQPTAPQRQPMQQQNTRNPGRGNQPTPPAYRSASPYTVPPRATPQRVPYPPSELQRRRQLRKKRQRQRMLLLSIVTLLCILLLAALIGTGILLMRHHAGASPGDSTASVPAMSADAADTAETTLSPIETAPPMPDYDAPHRIDGTPLIPVWNDTTVTLTDEVSCQYAILINTETGVVAAEKQSHEIIFPASMTKLMTVLVAYELIPDLEETYRMTNEIIDPVYLEGLSLAGFSGGEDVVIRDLLYGSALPSGAEASVALALAACGSEEAFVAKMNDRAKLLGMTNTHFENCTGAHHDSHVSTLYDIGILLAYMMQDETLAGILGTYQHTTTPTTQHPEGILLTSTVFSRMEGSESGVCTVLGGKTGYTAQGGQCLATYAETNTDGIGYVCVTANGDTKWRPVYDSIYLYQYHTQGTPPPATQQSPTE